MVSLHICRSTLAAALAVSVSFQSPAVMAAGEESAPVSILVQPIKDGDRDEDSVGLARTISDAMAVATQHEVVDPNLAGDVMGYHDLANAIDDSADMARAAISDAKDHYFQFRYEEAVAGLKRAIGILEAQDDRGQVGEALLDAYLSLVVASKSRGASKAAREALTSALELNPTLDLSEKDYPPSVMRLFDEVRLSVLGGPSGGIRVATSPPAAAVYLNGIPYGISPVDIQNLPVGIYRVSVRANKYEPIERDVEVHADSVARVKERLRWISRAPSKKGKQMRDAASEVNLGLHIADTMKVDKVILVDVDSMGEGMQSAGVRMVDRRYRAGHRPVVLEGGGEDGIESTADMIRVLISQADADMSQDPKKMVDPIGIGDPVLMGRRKSPMTRSPLFWGAIGVAAAGAIAGGIVAAMSQSSASEVGRVRVRFR